ncbi:MAG TPA: sigma-54 dependent transcriptional regulator [Vicinamibacteria bacterium]
MKVLVVEDQAPVAKALCVLLEVHDIPCVAVATPGEALKLLDGDVGLVIQDMNFSPGATSGEEGIDLFRRLRARDPDLPVLVITAWTSLETAVQMVKQGASDYLAKPWDDAKLVASARTLLRLRELQQENRALRASGAGREELGVRHDLRGIVYQSDAMHRVVALAVQVAAADVPVLITGPNGVGKEKLAEIVQANSRRRDKPFVKVNAGALPDELLESELFGAEAGAFTGAVRRRLGRFEAADGGTLFLDEIGNLSAAGQAKLLRVLQSGEFERLGSSETQQVDVRVLAATNADLREAMRRGAFRADLYFRLNVIELGVPPLRERPEDVLPLAEAFLRQFAVPGQPPRRLSPEARAALVGHSWPGNVRELANRVQRATLVAAGSELGPGDLGLGASAGLPAPGDLSSPGEREELEQLLVETGGRVSHAAERLGLSRQALYRRMERLGITLERRPKR